MARENLVEASLRLLSEMNHLAAFMEMEPLSLNALNLKITEFRTTGLDQIVDLLKKTEMTPEEKLALVEFFVSTKDLEQDRFTKALLNHVPVQYNFLRVLELTEVAEKYDSFFLGHEEIKTHWIQWYSNSKDATFNAETLREDIAALFEHKSKINQPELWSSNVLLRLRQASRVVLHSMESDSKRYDSTNVGMNESWNWIFDLHKKARMLALQLQSPHSEVFRLLLDYEQVVLFNTFEAYTRALDTISRCHSLLSQINSVDSSGIIHPFMHHPDKFISLLTNLTKSRCGMFVNREEVESAIEFCTQKIEHLDADPAKPFNREFEQLSLAIVHYFSILTLARCGFPLSNDRKDGQWHVFRALHPTFHKERVKAHTVQNKQLYMPWADDLHQAFSDLISPTSTDGQRDQNIRTLVENGKDLATNNPLAPSRKGIDRDSPLATQINLWINYIDMVKINFLRVTKHGGSHHLVRFGPIDRKSNELAWIKSAHQGRKAHEVEPEFFFSQYLAQGFRTSSDIRSTKMDRTNLISLIVNEMMIALEQHCPPTRPVKDFIKSKRDTRRKMQRPIFIPKQQIERVSKHHDIPAALHAHVALERIFELQSLVSEARAVLQLASIQETYRTAMKTILNAADELLALEFLHLLLIVQSHDVERTGFDAHSIVEQIDLDYNKKQDEKERLTVNERNRREQVRFDFLRHPYVQASGNERFTSILNDTRSSPFVQTLQHVHWWKFNLDEIDELKLAQTMVEWIKNQVNAGFVSIVHPRFGYEESTYPYPKKNKKTKKSTRE